MAILNNTGIRAGASGVSSGYQIAKSLRLDGTDDAHLNRTFASGGSTTTWTLSFWIKGADIAQACYIFTGGTGTSSYITMDASQFRFYSSGHDLKTNARYKDPTAWYHFVCVADTTNGTDNDKTRVYVNGTRLAVGDFATHTQPSASAALGDFNAAGTHYINRLTSGSQQDMMLAEVHFVDAAAKEASDFGEFHSTTGQWVPKEYAGTYGTTGFYLKFDGTDLGEDSSGEDNDWTPNNLTPAGDIAVSANYPTGSSGTIYEFKDAAVAVNPENSSYPTYQAFDGNDGTTGLIGQVVFQGTKPTFTNAGGGVELSGDGAGITCAVNEGTQVAIGDGTYTKISGTADGTLNSLNVYNNAAGASYFKGVKVDGVHIRVQRIADEVISDIDPSTDTPTSFDDGSNGTGNYCTLNPQGSDGALSQGNLTHDPGAGNYFATSTMGFTSGKWYGEFTLDTHAYPGIGVSYEAKPGAGWMATQAPYYFIYDNGSVLNNYPGGSEHFSSLPSTTFATGVWQVALDVDNGKCWIGYQDTWYSDQWATTGNPATGANPTFTLPSGKTWYFFLWSNGAKWTANFGQRTFAETKPSGFSSPNTYNLPDPTIADPSKHFEVSTWAGNGAASRSITGLNFQPDMVWGKNRDGNAPQLFDVIRGAGSAKELTPSANFDEGRLADPNTPVYGWLSAFNSDGFTVTEGSSASDGNFYWNESGSGHVAWSWEAGTTNVENDASETSIGSLDSIYRANTDAGFSIVTYTGNNTNPTTVAHGLNAKPAMILVKDRDTDGKEWIVYHKELGATKFMYLDTDSDVSTVAYAWNNTEPTSTVWSMQDFSNMNASGKKYVAYCWSEVSGYSKFGSYTGNGSAAGPYIYCGFTPRWLMLKQAHSGYNGSWVIYDTARTPTNSGENWIYANTTAAEAAAASYATTVTSNGFKLRSTSAENNGSGRNYIFAAFAEFPFKYANAR